MEAKVYRVPYDSRAARFRLIPLGDIHAGTVHCAEDRIQSKVDDIKNDPCARWIGMGDMAECITQRDKRWDTDSISPWVQRNNIGNSERKWLKELFKPIAGKCVGLLEGNHEASLRLYNDNDLMMDLCEDLGVDYLGATSFVNFVFTRQGGTTHSFLGWFSHGNGGAQTDGGKINNLLSFMRHTSAVILAKGHLHTIMVHEDAYLGITESDPPKITEMNRCCAMTGSWFYTYRQGERPSYAERKGYRPTRIGCPAFFIEPDKYKLNVYTNG